MIDLDILKQVPLFKGLTHEHLTFLQPRFQQHLAPKGTCILKEDTYGDQIYLLVEGSVQVTKDLVKGFDEEHAVTEKVLASLCGTDLPTFGENGVLGQGARTANIIATTDCVLYTLSQTEFESFARLSYEAAYIVMTNIATKISYNLKSTDENLVKLATALFIAVQQ